MRINYKKVGFKMNKEQKAIQQSNQLDMFQTVTIDVQVKTVEKMNKEQKAIQQSNQLDMFQTVTIDVQVKTVENKIVTQLALFS